MNNRTDFDLYYDPQSKEYRTLECRCDFCRSLLVVSGFIFQKYARSKKIDNKIVVCCRTCIGKNETDSLLYDHWEGKPFKVIFNIKTSWQRVYFVPPQHKNYKGDVSIYDAAEKQIGGEVTNDNTLLAGRETFNPNLLAERDEKLRLLDENLSTKNVDVDGFVEEQKNIKNTGEDYYQARKLEYDKRISQQQKVFNEKAKRVLEYKVNKKLLTRKQAEKELKLLEVKK